MSEIAKLQQLTELPIAPPMSWYFDPHIMAVEQRTLLFLKTGLTTSAMN